MRLIAFAGEANFQALLHAFNEMRNKLTLLNHLVVAIIAEEQRTRRFPIMPPPAEVRNMQIDVDQLMELILTIDELENQVIQTEIMQDGVLGAAFRGVSNLESEQYSGYFDFPEWHRAWSGREYLLDIYPDYSFKPLGNMIMILQEQMQRVVENWETSKGERIRHLMTLCWRINDTFSVLSDLMVTTAQAGIMISAAYKALADRMAAGPTEHYDYWGRVQTPKAEISIPATVIDIDRFVDYQEMLEFTRIGTFRADAMNNMIEDTAEVITFADELEQCPGDRPHSGAKVAG